MDRVASLFVLAVGVAALSASCGGVGGQSVESGFAENGLIAFAHGEGGLADISVVNPDGSGREVLVATDEDELWPAWSPDGTKIAYTTDESGLDRESMAIFSHGDIVVITADGSAPISITERYDGIPDPDAEDGWG